MYRIQWFSNKQTNWRTKYVSYLIFCH